MEAPELFQADQYCSSQFTAPNVGGDAFVVEDFFDFSNEEAVGDDAAFEAVTAHSTDESTVFTTDTCNSFSGSDHNIFGKGPSDLTNFSGDLCLPYDDLAQLEWLSNFVEDSFSSEDQQKLQLITGFKGGNQQAEEAPQFRPQSNTIPDAVPIMDPTATHANPIFDDDVSVPAKARSKRSRAAPCNWASRLLTVSPTHPEHSSSSSSSTGTAGENIVPAFPTGGKKTVGKRKESGGEQSNGGRRCLHCATDKTPQWRTGPMGPKTLCNACGVRYKSGRLVPEYRPAASPTFVLTKHSNSHRKVLELRRQKEVVRAQQQFLSQHHQGVVFDDFLIHQNVGPDFSQLI